MRVNELLVLLENVDPSAEVIFVNGNYVEGTHIFEYSTGYYIAQTPSTGIVYEEDEMNELEEETGMDADDKVNAFIIKTNN